MGRKNRSTRRNNNRNQKQNRNQTNASYNEYEYEEEARGFAEAFNLYDVEKFRKKLDSFQKEFIESIGKYRVVFVDAVAGSGKTTLAVMRGLELLREGKVNKIIYIRFPDKRGQKLGFLPGNDKEKTTKYMKPFRNACKKFGLRDEDVLALELTEVFELGTDSFLRGDTFENAYLIIDEAQNGDIEDLKLVLTRLEISGYGIIIGHSGQMDNKVPAYGPNKWNPFQVYAYHMQKKPFATTCELKINYRGPISQWADKIDETIKELKELA